MIQKILNLIGRLISASIFLFKYYLTRNRLGNLLYSSIKDYRYDTGFRQAPTDFFRTAYADPEHITLKINRTAYLVNYPYTQMGRIDTSDHIPSVKFDNYYVYTSLYDHFVNDLEWSRTAYYTMAFDNLNVDELGWGQISTQKELDEFFAEIDAVYQSIASEGYVECSELNTKGYSIFKSLLIDPIQAHDEVFIDIGSDGELLLVDGRHRPAIARILGLDQIPVRILARHRQWCQFRRDLFESIRSNGLAGETTKYPIFHPEFRHLESRYDPEVLADRIESVVDPADGPIIEHDPGVSATLLHELAQRGYDVIAIVRDDDQKQFVEWYANFADIEVETKRLSQQSDLLVGGAMIALDPVDRTGVRKCLERGAIEQLITSGISGDHFGGAVDVVDVSDLVR